MVKQSGFLMMVIAVLLVVIAGLATAFVSMIISGTNSSISTISANNAYDLAITGIENGSYQLSLGMCDNAWSTTILIPGQGNTNTIAVKIKLQQRLPVLCLFHRPQFRLLLLPISRLLEPYLSIQK